LAVSALGLGGGGPLGGGGAGLPLLLALALGLGGDCAQFSLSTCSALRVHALTHLFRWGYLLNLIILHIFKHGSCKRFIIGLKVIIVVILKAPWQL
jgi:hypothetical protein